MKVLEQARSSLPQKSCKSSKQADKGSSKPEMFSTDTDDTETANVSKSSSAAAGKSAGKIGKLSSAATSAANKKVQFMFCLVLCIDCYCYKCNILQMLVN